MHLFQVYTGQRYAIYINYQKFGTAFNLFMALQQGYCLQIYRMKRMFMILHFKKVDILR